MDQVRVAQLEALLCSNDDTVRMRAILALAKLARDLPWSDVAPNMHCHDFFSYNPYGWTPERLVWEARKVGMRYLGVVGFDGMMSYCPFVSACDIFGVKGVLSIETRIWVPEITVDVNSPGVPGEIYAMIVGVTPQSGMELTRKLEDFRDYANRRNREIVSRLNEHLGLSLEYDDLRARVPGVVMERHIAAAFVAAVETSTSSFAERNAFWASALHTGEDIVERLVVTNKLVDEIRKLFKAGGSCAVEPSGELWPSLDDFGELTALSGGIPFACVLDGVSPFEKDVSAMFNWYVQNGFQGWNFIQQRMKEATEILRWCDQLYTLGRSMPFIAGTELNSPSQQLVMPMPSFMPSDPFDMGAAAMYGHQVMKRLCDHGMASDWANEHFGKSAQLMQEFYADLGRRVYPSSEFDRNAMRFGTSPAAITRLLDGI